MNRVKFKFADDPSIAKVVTVTQSKNQILYGRRRKRRPSVAEANRFMLSRRFVRS